MQLQARLLVKEGLKIEMPLLRCAASIKKAREQGERERRELFSWSINYSALVGRLFVSFMTTIDEENGEEEQRRLSKRPEEINRKLTAEQRHQRA